MPSPCDIIQTYFSFFWQYSNALQNLIMRTEKTIRIKTVHHPWFGCKDYFYLLSYFCSCVSHLRIVCWTIDYLDRISTQTIGQIMTRCISFSTISFNDALNCFLMLPAVNHSRLWNSARRPSPVATPMTNVYVQQTFTMHSASFADLEICLIKVLKCRWHAVINSIKLKSGSSGRVYKYPVKAEGNVLNDNESWKRRDKLTNISEYLGLHQTDIRRVCTCTTIHLL